MTYREWTVYLDYESRNVITRAKNYLKSKNVFRKSEKYDFDKFMDAFDNVVLPCFTDNVHPAPEFIKLCIDVAELLINTYYKYFSKSMKYIAKVLSTVKKEHRTNKYLIFIPMYVLYQSEEMAWRGYKYIKVWKNTGYSYRY